MGASYRKLAALGLEQRLTAGQHVIMEFSPATKDLLRAAVYSAGAINPAAVVLARPPNAGKRRSWRDWSITYLSYAPVQDWESWKKNHYMRAEKTRYVHFNKFARPHDTKRRFEFDKGKLVDACLFINKCARYGVQNTISFSRFQL